MCHFITLVVPTHDAVAVQTVMERHGRAARPTDNPSIRKVLRDEEHQYLSTRGHCDCGTVLARYQETPESFEDKLAKEAARMKRKGWSNTKIARALEDQRKADAKPIRGGLDSLELWSTILLDLRNELKLPYAGLFIRFYSGEIDTETFTASRREVLTGWPWQEALASLKEDEVTIFR